MLKLNKTLLSFAGSPDITVEFRQGLILTSVDPSGDTSGEQGRHKPTVAFNIHAGQRDDYLHACL